jgi:hypothetical protein
MGHTTLALFLAAAILVGLFGRAAAAVRRALGIQDERSAVFHRVVAAVSGAWHRVERVSETEGPAQAALTGWLVREGESGLNAIVAPGAALGVDGVGVALPLRRDNSALAGFLAFVAPRPALDGGGSQEPEPLETVADPRDFALVRFDER